MPHVLAFDTSTEAMSIALVTPSADHLVDGEGGARASSRLIPAALALLDRQGVSLARLDAIAFGRGPGAFTGLRTACAVAQGLALGAGKPVLGLDSLMLVAEQAAGAAGEDLELWVAMDARMDEIYAGCYRRTDGQWRCLVEPLLARVDALNARWAEAPPRAVAGSALDVFDGRLQVGTARRIATPQGRAAALARLARREWAAGQTLDAALALPVYVRDKVAQTTAEREAAQAAKVAAG